MLRGSCSLFAVRPSPAFSGAMMDPVPQPQRPPATPREPAPFDLRTFLDSAGLKRTIRKYARSVTIFAPGDPANDVCYIQSGRVKLSVLSRTGKEAVVAILGPGDFFGEGCLAAQPRRIATASAMTASTALVIEKPQMVALLRTEPSLAQRFLAHMLARNIRVEEDLVNQLFNPSKKRLARVLLLLARYGINEWPLRSRR
jgi:CRP/FNR family cyclic AMP-dependent transcriptional regulator